VASTLPNIKTQARADRSFALQARRRGLVAAQLTMENFERDEALEPALLRQVHARHRAHTEQALDLELPRDDAAQVRVSHGAAELGTGGG
jgi:hypothetical protein